MARVAALRRIALPLVVAVAAAIVALVVCTAARSSSSATDSLDSVPRLVATTGRLSCPRVPLMRYAGTRLRYSRPVLVHPSFREHLVAFEELVGRAALETYGRVPVGLVHVGAYNCRRVAGWPMIMSEHGLGNAIDVVGFDFGPARGAARVSSAPRGRFAVRLSRDWRPAPGRGELHAQFLRRIFEQVRAPGSPFRAALGPGDRGHSDHFHLDRSPAPARSVWMALRSLLMR
jgi:hypothetical protein